MNILSRIVVAPVTPGSNAKAIIAAGKALVPYLERGERIDAAILRDVMEQALRCFGFLRRLELERRL